MKLKDILLQVEFNDIYKEIKSRKLKKKILPLQELYANLRKDSYILNLDIKAELDTESIEGISIKKNGLGINQFDNLTLNEVATIEINDIENSKKIIAYILTFYTLQGEVFNDKKREKELEHYKLFTGSNFLLG